MPSLALRVELLELHCASLCNLLGEMIATLALPRNGDQPISALAPYVEKWQSYLDMIENPIMPEGVD